MKNAWMFYTGAAWVLALTAVVFSVSSIHKSNDIKVSPSTIQPLPKVALMRSSWSEPQYAALLAKVEQNDHLSLKATPNGIELTAKEIKFYSEFMAKLDSILASNKELTVSKICIGSSCSNSIMGVNVVGQKMEFSVN